MAANSSRGVVTLLGYQPEQPSFRYRMQALAPALSADGWKVQVERFPARRHLLRTYSRRKMLRASAVLILHQIKLAATEARLLYEEAAASVRLADLTPAWMPLLAGEDLDIASAVAP